MAVYEVELPAVYLDGLALDATPPGLSVLNRNPEPGEVEVPLGATLAMDITSTTASDPDPASLLVYVDGQLAYGAGAFQPSFSGLASAVTQPQPETLHVVVQPQAPFSSLAAVTVRVVAATLDGASQLDTSWTFTCADLTPPVVVGAQARAQKVLRVSFSEEVVQDAGITGADALNPANYSVQATTAPTVTPTPVEVQVVSPTAVDVVLSTELTAGAGYLVTVTGVEDLKGNVIVAPANAVAFQGFAPTRPAGRNFTLFQLLAQMNRNEDRSEDLLKFTSCLQEVLDLLLYDVDRFTDTFDPDLAEEQFLDAMLADLGNPFDFDLSEIDKRRLLSVLVSIYRQKGTAVGLVNAIRFFLALECTVVTYLGEGLGLGDAELGVSFILGPGGSWGRYAFEVDSPVVLTEDQRTRIIQLANYMKPAHTHLARVVEPMVPTVVDHVELGLSELGDTFLMH